MHSFVRIVQFLALVPTFAMGGGAWAHSDPAPIPDEVVQHMKGKLRESRPHPLPRVVNQRLNAAAELLRQLDDVDIKGDSASQNTRRNEKQSLLNGKIADLRNLREEVGRQMTSHGTTPSGAATATQALGQIHRRFDQLEQSLRAIQAARSRPDRGLAIERAMREVARLTQSERQLAALSEPEVGVWTPRPMPPLRHSAPAKTIPRYLVDALMPRFAQLDGEPSFVRTAADPTPSEAGVCGYDANDVNKNDPVNSPETVVTPEIEALAASLNYSVVKIYQWVTNNVKFEANWGSLKGAQGTLYALSGGPTDQASLLIALLRASNIPSRYVRGIVRFRDDARVNRWIGAKTYGASKNILLTGGYPDVVLDYGQDQVTLSDLRFGHVWVEACVPYGSYRGTRIDNSGHRWIPLDSSYKEMDPYQPGISGVSAAGLFDYPSYMSTRTPLLPHQEYAKRVEAWAKTQPPHYQNNTLQDVPFAGRQTLREFDVLPSTLPYRVHSFTAWGGGNNYAEAAYLPNAHRYMLRITLQSSANVTLMPEQNFPMAAIALKRLTLSFKGLTTADQTAMDNVRATQGPTSETWTCSGINAVPVLKVEGVDQIFSAGSVGFCTSNHKLTMSITLGQLPPTNTVQFLKVAATDYHSLQVYSSQVSDRLLTERSAMLLNSVRTLPSTAVEQTEGEFLHLVGLKYMRYISDAFRQVSSLDGAYPLVGYHLGMTFAKSQVSYVLDVPYAISRKGFVIDVPGGQMTPIDLFTGALNWNTFKLAGYSGSAYESYVWQENAKLDAVSSVSGIQFAGETGIPVREFVRDNVGQYNTLMEMSGPYSMAGLQSTITSLAFDNYWKVTIPRQQLQLGTWRGPVYIAEKQSEFKALFAITGTYFGGWTAGALDSYIDNVNLTNWLTGVQSNPGSISAGTAGVLLGGITDVGATVNQLQGNVDALDVNIYGNGMGGNGAAPANVYTADPVNSFTGNVYHVERDIVIKGRGGLPIVFERSYNSRYPADGPLGWGWTHSFNQFLLFRDVSFEGNATSGNDTDGITSSVTWMDGSGAEKRILVTGSSAGGVPVGATFSPPKGMFFIVTKTAAGYVIREKNGLTYNFENIAGTINQKARLVSIVDRNGNALTLDYTSIANCPGGAYVCRVTDTIGRGVLTFAYSNNRITQVTDYTGRAFQYGYDANGNLTSFKNPLAVAGKQPAVTYDYIVDGTAGSKVNHAMKSFTLPRGNGMVFEYYMNGRAFRQCQKETPAATDCSATNPKAATTTVTFSYNEFRRETVVVNERGLTKRFFFNEWGNPSTIVEENGATHTYTYDTNNPYLRVSKTDPMGYVTGYQYDAQGNVIQVTNPSGSTVVFSHFNAFNQPGKIKDARGNYTILKYDANGNLTDTIALRAGVGAAVNPVGYVPPAGDVVSWTNNAYAGYGNLASTKRVKDFASQAGPKVEFDYDGQGLNATVTRRRNADNSILSSATLGYDALNRQTAGVHADWHPWNATYDEVDRVVRSTDGAGQMRDYLYDNNGNALGENLRLGNSLADSITHAYDLADRRISTTNAGGFRSLFEYDGVGNLIRVQNPDNYTVRFDYDAGNKVVKAYDEVGNAVTRTLDVDGKPRTVTDPNGNVTTYTYYDSTKDGRLSTVTLPIIQNFTVGRQSIVDYDANGNVIVSRDGTGTPRITHTQYDELNRAIRVIGPAYTDAVHGLISPVVKYTYSPLGQLIRIDAGRTGPGCVSACSDVVAQQFAYDYDDFGRKLKERDGLNREWTFANYDDFGNARTVTDPKGNITTMTWAYGNRLLTRTSTAGNVSYVRNVLGQITSATTNSAGNAATLVTYTYTYDAAQRLRSVTDSRGNKTLTYTYSAGGRLNQLADNEGRATNFLYDNVGRLSGIQAPGAAGAEVNYTFRYDAGGRRTERRVSNGLTTLYSYNPDNSLQQVRNLLANGAVMSQHDYTYDPYGNRVTHAQNVASNTLNYGYGYDELSRLVSVTGGLLGAESYSYDPLNNLKSRLASGVTTNYNHDAANQLLEVMQGGTRVKGMVYDTVGNLTQKCEGGTITLSPTACSGASVANYTYDALNRMSAATVTGAPNHSFTYDDQGRRLSKTAGATTTHYLYNGQDILAEYQGTWSAALAHLTHGPGTDEPLQRVQGATASFYLQDGLGSVVAAVPHTDVNNGANAAFQMFDAWGNRTQGSGTVANYGYTGREPDATGLIYYRARYYDPSIQRFTQRDPIGVAGGVNAYAYVGNSPVMLTDPSGTVPEGASNTGGCSGVADGGVFPRLFPEDIRDTPALRDRYYFMYAMASAAFGARSDAVGNQASGLEDSDASPMRNEIFADNVQLYCINPSKMAEALKGPQPQSLAAQLGDSRLNALQSVPAPWEIVNPVSIVRAGVTALGIRSVATQSEQFLFRGTTEGFAGSPGLQRIAITPTSTDPVVATIFAIEASNYGRGVVLVAPRAGLPTVPGNVLAGIEAEIGVAMSPSTFAAHASSVGVAEARSALGQLGIQLPGSISRANLSSVLNNTPRLTGQQTESFRILLGM